MYTYFLDLWLFMLISYDMQFWKSHNNLRALFTLPRFLCGNSRAELLSSFFDTAWRIRRTPRAFPRQIEKTFTCTEMGSNVFHYDTGWNYFYTFKKNLVTCPNYCEVHSKFYTVFGGYLTSHPTKSMTYTCPNYCVGKQSLIRRSVSTMQKTDGRQVELQCAS